MTENSGTLFVVATPIGNLDDLSQRARDTLRQVSCVYAEDTRHSLRLLDHYDISTDRRSLHEHNETVRCGEIVQRLQQGEHLAIISDAGTPLLSDPGFRVVSACVDEGLRVCPIPGASALLAALCVSGQSVDSFVFIGFPPQKKQARLTWLEQLQGESRTMILYESPHRIVATLQAMVAVFGGDRSATIARELTKRHESISKASLSDHVNDAQTGKLVVKGEFVIVVAGQDRGDASSLESEDQELRRVLTILLLRMGPRESADCAVELMGVRKNQAYRLALELAAN